MCSDKVNPASQERHVCYLKRDKLKTSKQLYWTYDFEACIDPETQRHVIYLATAWPLYPIQMTDSLRRYETHEVPNYPNQPVFVFWGLGGVKKLFDFFHDPICYQTTFFAHNAGKYDSVFIEKYMLEMHGEIPHKLQRGTRIMQMVFDANQVTFKDSLCFIPSSLRSMPSSFGIQELAKGFFPHRLMTVPYMQDAEAMHFIVPKPPRDVWQTEFSRGKDGLKEKRELEEFLAEFYATPEEPWNLRRDAVRYCISDTVLLGCVLIMFQQECRRSNAEWDVLASVTLPSAVMNLFMSTALPEKTLSVVDRYKSLQLQNAIKWVWWMVQEQPTELVDYFKHPEVVMETDSTCYIYLDCYEHGCPRCYPTQARNLRRDIPFWECYQRHFHILQDIRRYCAVRADPDHPEKSVVTIWEHEYKKLSRTKEFKDWMHTNDYWVNDLIPLDPRDAYKGGVSEIYKIFHPDSICMSDFVSQYPTSMLGYSYDPRSGMRREWQMPTGDVRIFRFPDLRMLRSNKLGIIKCRVLPPQRLYVPFLGYRAHSQLVKNSYEVLYGLCKTCMEERHDGDCLHTDEARSFTGTWTIAEIKYAQSVGYQVLHITELWEYEGSSNTLFSSFIVPFIKGKIMSKKDGLVDDQGQFTAFGSQIADYLQEINQFIGRAEERVLAEDFQNSPVIRTTNKLIINALYGKFGQRPIWPCSSVFTESEEDIKRCDQLLHDESSVISSFELIPRRKVDGTDEVLAIISYEKNYAASRGDCKKHDMIAAHITAYGRIMLNETAQLLGDRMCGCDTDSLAHTKMDPLPYHIGFRIGDLELELPEAKTWVGGGRKSYMYETMQGKTVCKQKGVSLKLSMENVFTLENMLSMIRETTQIVEELQEAEGITRAEALEMLHRMAEDRPSLDVPQMQFITQRNALQGEKVTRQSIKKTRFLLEAAKRRIVPRDNMIDTLPFGWVREE
jgi:hypothetical protein